MKNDFIKKTVTDIIISHMSNGCVTDLEYQRCIAEAYILGNQAAVFHNFEGADAREIAEEVIDGRDNP